MTQNDTQLNGDRPPLQSLLTILRFEVWNFETSLHCRSWMLVNRERPDSKPEYPYPCAPAVRITGFTQYSPWNGSYGHRIITWFYPLRTYSFAPLPRFGLLLTPDSYSNRVICRLAACQRQTERPGDWCPNWSPRQVSYPSLYILPMSALMRIMALSV